MRLIDADALMERLQIANDCGDCIYQDGPDCANAKGFVDACAAICTAPTIDPEWPKCSEFCFDCPLYDHEHYNCPRFNKVIPGVLSELLSRWIPCSEQQPQESGWYLVTAKTGNVDKAYYRVARPDQGGSYWHRGIRKPLAWMPLPKPFKETT